MKELEMKRDHTDELIVTEQDEPYYETRSD